jgi:hypothetical protein
MSSISIPEMMSDHNTALVSAYRKSKRTDLTTRGFGLKLGCPLRDRWVTPGFDEVVLKLEGSDSELTVRLLPGFWHDCPEFIDEAIYGWIVSQGLTIPWAVGEPYRFEMMKTGENKFSVRRLSARAGG